MATGLAAVELIEFVESLATEIAVEQSANATALIDGLANVAETSFVEAGENAAFVGTEVYGAGTGISEQAGEILAEETLDTIEESTVGGQQIEESFAAAQQDAALETQPVISLEQAPEEIELQQFTPQSETIFADDQETAFIQPRTSTPAEGVARPLEEPRPRTSRFAREFFERNSLVTRPLRRLAGRARTRFIYENLPSHIEMDDIVVQDRQLQNLTRQAETSFVDELDVESSETVPKPQRTFEDVDDELLGDSGLGSSQTIPKRVFSIAESGDMEILPEVPEAEDGFRGTLPIEEEGIPTFIENIPRRLRRPLLNSLKKYARRFGLTIEHHKYFVLFLAAVTGLNLAYLLAGPTKRHVITSFGTPDQKQHPTDDKTDIKTVMQGIKDFAKVITSNVPDVEKKMKHLFKATKKLTKEILIQAINHLEQVAYENMIKKKLTSELDLKTLVNNINNPLMWGLSEVLGKSNINNVMVLLNQLAPQIPQSLAKYNVLQLP